MADKEDAKYSFTFNFNAPVGQNIAHVDKLEAHFDKDMTMQVMNPAVPADETSEQPSETVKSARGPRMRYLFVKNGYDYEEDEAVKEREKERFLSYLSQHDLKSRELVCKKDDTLNKTIVCFLKCWKERNMISDPPCFPAIFRFLRDDCGLKSSITERSYANKISEQFKDMKEKNEFESCTYIWVKDSFNK